MAADTDVATLTLAVPDAVACSLFNAVSATDIALELGLAPPMHDGAGAAAAGAGEGVGCAASASPIARAAAPDIAGVPAHARLDHSTKRVATASDAPRAGGPKRRRVTAVPAASAAVGDNVAPPSCAALLALVRALPTTATAAREAGSDDVATTRVHRADEAPPCLPCVADIVCSAESDECDQVLFGSRSFRLHGLHVC